MSEYDGFITDFPQYISKFRTWGFRVILAGYSSVKPLKQDSKSDPE